MASEERGGRGGRLSIAERMVDWRSRGFGVKWLPQNDRCKALSLERSWIRANEEARDFSKTSSFDFGFGSVTIV